MDRQAQSLGAVVAGEVRLELPGREQHLGDAAQFDRIVAGLDGPGAGFDRELAGERKTVQRALQPLRYKTLRGAARWQWKGIRTQPDGRQPPQRNPIDPLAHESERDRPGVPAAHRGESAPLSLSFDGKATTSWPTTTVARGFFLCSEMLRVSVSNDVACAAQTSREAKPRLLKKSCTRTNKRSKERKRAAGIEPASSAWKAEVLPLNYARIN